MKKVRRAFKASDGADDGITDQRYLPAQHQEQGWQRGLLGVSYGARMRDMADPDFRIDAKDKGEVTKGTAKKAGTLR